MKVMVACGKVMKASEVINHIPKCETCRGIKWTAIEVEKGGRDAKSEKGTREYIDLRGLR